MQKQQLVIQIIDIVLVVIILAQLFRIMRGTKGFFFLNGILVLFLTYWASLVWGLKYLSLLLLGIMLVLAVALPIIFQNELKRALESFGRRNPLVKWFLKPPVIATESIDIVAEAVAALAEARVGALIVFEREDPLPLVSESGQELDAVLSQILLEQIFQPHSPLHDGAVLIKGSRIQAAGCFLPLDNELPLPQKLGSRHRAGLTLAAQSDALVVIVSEESGRIALAHQGILEQNCPSDQLRYQLRELVELAGATAVPEKNG